jgi:hypothetical protein
MKPLTPIQERLVSMPIEAAGEESIGHLRGDSEGESIMAKLPDGYKPPKKPVAADIKIGETCPFHITEVREDDEENLFLHDDANPLRYKEHESLIGSDECVLIRRDPEGLVLILRPRNKGALKHLMPLLSTKNHRPIIRIEKQ